MALDIILVILGICFLILGIAGCILPMIPGPPLAYIALIFLQLTSYADFSVKFLVITGLLTVIVTVLDFIVPVWGTKKLGGSKAGVWGATAGLVIGLFFSPIGIILGPFVGAVVAELIVGRKMEQALIAGTGSFIGFIFGSALKLTLCFVFCYYFIKELIV